MSAPEVARFESVARHFGLSVAGMLRMLVQQAEDEQIPADWIKKAETALAKAKRKWDGDSRRQLYLEAATEYAKMTGGPLDKRVAKWLVVAVTREEYES